MSKYGAKKIIVNGVKFDSKKEANRWQELCLLQRAGKIKHLQRQVRYELIPAQYEEVEVYTPKTHKKKIEKKLVERSLHYVADFVYEKNGKQIVEDVKGYKMGGAYNMFTVKRKLMLYFYGIRIDEV